MEPPESSQTSVLGLPRYPSPDDIVKLGMNPDKYENSTAAVPMAFLMKQFAYSVWLVALLTILRHEGNGSTDGLKCRQARALPQVRG